MIILYLSFYSMAGEWDDLASGYRNEFIKLLWEQTGLEPTAKRVVVDFGCGTGLLTEALRKQSPSSEFICIDAAPTMVRVLEEKIESLGWDSNSRAHCVALANLDTADEKIRKDLEALKGSVDLVVASSVMSFIPGDDLPGTMKVIGELLKPETGLFCHSDWPKSEENSDGFDEEKAKKMYAMGELEAKSSYSTKVNMGGSNEGEVYVGVALKKK
jgi:predicted TPR repeat methyltransferase